MAGKNKGKKYIKLTGSEIATPENEARAQKFMTWYGRMSEYIQLRLINPKVYDDEVATDTALFIYESIALKGKVVDNFRAYFLIAYRLNYIAAKKREGVTRVNYVSIDAEEWSAELVAPDYDYVTFENSVDLLKTEMLEYVRAKYPPVDVSIFEIYIALQPNISYPKLASMLGLPVNSIWQPMANIRKDLAATFSARRDFLLSLH